ncbi:hypothetical protein XELAEV_18015009mg, partial [Xenopus laevis]
ILEKPKTTGLLAPLRMGTFECIKCAHCTGIIKGDSIAHPTKGTPIKIRGHFTCNCSNVIYLIKCPCGLPYVGQTSRCIKIRLNEHKSNIKNYNPEKEKLKNEDAAKFITELSVAKHFYHAKHTAAQVRWTILEQIKMPRGGNINQQLLRRETFWINKIDSLSPRGLNECFGLRCFL